MEILLFDMPNPITPWLYFLGAFVAFAVVLLFFGTIIYTIVYPESHFLESWLLILALFGAGVGLMFFAFHVTDLKDEAVIESLSSVGVSVHEVSSDDQKILGVLDDGTVISGTYEETPAGGRSFILYYNEIGN